MLTSLKKWWKRTRVSRTAAGRCRARPSVEQLEDRLTPAAPIFSLNSGVLTVVDSGPGKHTESAYTTPGMVAVTADGVTQSFSSAAVTRLNLIGSQRGLNVIQNTTALPAVIIGGPKADTLFPGTGGTVGNPSDFVVATGRGTTTYALVGVHVLIDAGPGHDRIITNPTNTVLSQPSDQVITFFAGGRTPGSGTVALVNGVLYVSPTNNGSTGSLDYVGSSIVLTEDLGDGNGPQTYTYARNAVKFFAFFGGTGNDVMVNNTRVSNAMYGSAGSDFLVGGFGSYDLIKLSSGNNETAIGRARVNDLSANSGTGKTLIALNGFGHNVFRTALNGSTTVVGQAPGDVVISP